MRNQLLLILTLFIGNAIYSQQTPIAKLLPDGSVQFVNKATGASLNDLSWDEAGKFVNGFAKVSHAGKWGFIDETGSPLLQPTYNSVRNFVHKLAAVQLNNKWGFIDEKGNLVIPIIYDIAYDFKENVTAVYQNNKWYLINRSGALLKALDVDVFYGFKNGLANISKEGRKGVMNIAGTIVSLDKAITVVNKKKVAARVQSSLAAVCPDNIGFEDGNFTNWNCYIGTVAAVGTTNVITVSPIPTPAPNRQVIYPKATPSLLDPYGLFPINPPDGSNFALKLGNNINGAQAERVSYQIVVPAGTVDASITYRYAVVFQDPGHASYQQPRFSAKLLDIATNTYLPCASFEYVANNGLPGFFNSTIDDTVKCKNWASVYINLRAYAGKTLSLEFTTADCTKGAHWGYAYVDVGDCNITADIQYKCNPSTATLTGPPGFQNYNWYDTNYANLLGTGQNLVLTPAPPINGLLHVEVIPFPGFGCTDTLNVKVVNSDPIADAGPDQTLCAGKSTTIGTPAVQGNIYTWSPGLSLSDSTAASPTAAPTETTTYYLSVTNPGNGCTHYDTVTITVNPNPVALFDSIADQCLNGNKFIFTNLSTGATSYTWTLGDGTGSLLANPVHSYANAQAYIAKLVVSDNNGCTDSVSQPFVVHPNPVVTTSIDTAICKGKTFQIQTSGALNYSWTPAGSLSCSNCANPVASPVVNTQYIVKGTTSFGCPASDTLNINVYQPFPMTISPDKTICALSPLSLLASGAASYSWSPSQGLSSTVIANPVATPGTTTQYQVIGYDGHNCFSDTALINITVNPNPTVDLGPDLVLPTGTIYPFNPITSNGPIISWLWTPNTDLSCNTCPTPSATIKNNITYYLQVENSYGCTATDSIKIRAFCEGSQVFIPNAFTPDGDGLNDVLMIRGKGISTVVDFKIYSRWGELIFEKKNFPPNVASFGWDGKIRGVTAPAEVYVYTAEVMCDNMEIFIFKGNITLLK